MSWVGRPSSWARQHIVNELAWALGMGRLGDITHHLPVYIGGCLEANDHHSNNTCSKKEFCSGWMSLHDGWNSGVKLVQKSRVRNSGEKLRQKTCAENSGEDELERGHFWAKSFRPNSGEVVGRKLRRGHRVENLGEVIWANRARSSGDPGEVVRVS